jgi:hypothetical protein
MPHRWIAGMLMMGMALLVSAAEWEAYRERHTPYQRMWELVSEWHTTALHGCADPEVAAVFSSCAKQLAEQLEKM